MAENGPSKKAHEEVYEFGGENSLARQRSHLHSQPSQRTLPYEKYYDDLEK